jgi:hypothetical protein
MTGLRASRWVPVENASFSAAKLLLLVFLATGGAQGVFLAWALPVVPVVVVVNLYLFSRRIPLHVAASGGASALPTRRRLASFVAAEYAASLVTSVATYLLPIVVVDSLGAKAGAYFYVPWVVGVVLHALLWNISTAYVVEAGYSRERLAALLRRWWCW